MIDIGCSEDAKILHVQPASEVHTGRRGRPRKDVHPDILADAMAPGRGIAVTTLAGILGMHRHTLSNIMKRHGIARTFSDVTDEDLDELVQLFRQANPDGGLYYFIGFLRKNHLRVPRARIKAALRRADPLADQLRESVASMERTYSATRPNKVWHLDGHHKLIRWGFVIHGIVDGYCRTVSTPA